MNDEPPATHLRPLAFVDLETTGGDARYHRVIEVGIVELDVDGSAREWSTLVNPECRVPSRIEEFTGISNAMVETAPRFREVIDEIERRLAGRLFVAHNARFDYGFLRQEFQRGGRRLRTEVLCTVKLSRLLYPEAGRHNLDAVMERHGLSTVARHRALGDARVLFELWQVLGTRWPTAALAAAVEQLARRVVLPPQLPADLADDLPDGPGVYRFLGENRALLYIGKAKSIRARVLGHFAAAASGGKEAKLARLVRHLEWTETAGELGALLLEAQLVKSEQPAFNRRLRAAGTLHTIELVPVSGWLQARVVPFDSTPSSAVDRYGLFRKPGDAERALNELARTHMLCAKRLGREAGDGSCFGYQVGRCRGACVNLETPQHHGLRVQLAVAALKVASWPFAGAIAVTEHDPDGHGYAHVFDHWSYLGTTDDDAAAERLVRQQARVFDPDIYRVLRSYLARPQRRAVRELPLMTDTQ
jgi:DNA polymerase-3 subunit epsilon